MCIRDSFVPAQYSLYLKFSKIAKEIYYEYTNQVESFGIDECWLDITSSTKKEKYGQLIADEIRRRIQHELGVSVSIGVSFKKTFAKMGSDMKKPNATTVIERADYKEKIWPLFIEDLIYVGRATKQKLNKMDIYTVGDLANADISLITKKLGVVGDMLWNNANGFDFSRVTEMGYMLSLIHI